MHSGVARILEQGGQENQVTNLADWKMYNVQTAPPPSSLETWIEMYFWEYMANLSQMHSWKCAL